MTEKKNSNWVNMNFRYSMKYIQFPFMNQNSSLRWCPGFCLPNLATVLPGDVEATKPEAMH